MSLFDRRQSLFQRGLLRPGIYPELFLQFRYLLIEFTTGVLQGLQSLALLRLSSQRIGLLQI